MKKLLLITCILAIAAAVEGQIIHVPADYPTIQQGIDAAINGDTVLIDPGTYLENIIFNGKNITVASLFLITQDTVYIMQTIIDGNPEGSVVTFSGGENSTAVLCGLTLINGHGGGGATNANGGGIYCEYSSPCVENTVIKNNEAGLAGGGIYCEWSDMTLMNVKIIDNWVTGNGPLPGFAYGGGIYCSNSNPNLTNVTICNNAVLKWPGGLYGGGVSFGGGIYCNESCPVFDSIHRCSIYQNNAADGTDLYSMSSFEVILDTFTVLYPTDFYAAPLNNFSFDIHHGIVQQVDANLYISPSGDNSNSGLTADEPLKNIFYAFSLLRADNLHIHTIYLSEGIYSPSSTEETFPVKIIDYVNLEGTEENEVIMDAEDTEGVLEISYNTSNTVSKMTLTRGDGSFGGIHCYHSNPVLQNLNITSNNAYIQLQGGWDGSGGGIKCSNSSPCLSDIKINNNTAGQWGGGIYFEISNPIITNVSIMNNSAANGGGVFFGDSDAALHHVSITGNSATGFNSSGGGIYAVNSQILFDEADLCNIYMNVSCQGNEIYSNFPLVVVTDTFTVINPTEFLAYPLYNFTFNILNPLFDQVSADLYVSPAGNNFNSGLTPEEPLQSIHCALSVIIPDIQNPHTINLLEGIYSHSSNSEQYPLGMPDYINLCGESPDEVILDADNQAGVMHISENSSNIINGLTIKGGSNHGISMLDASPHLINVNIKDNHSSYGCYAGGFGGGIFCEDSNPKLQNVILSNNWAGVTGGSAYFQNSNPSIINILIIDSIYPQRLSCETSTLEIINSTIIDHQIFLNYGSVCTIVNSVIWNTESDCIYLSNYGGYCTVNLLNSDIKNGQQGIGGSGIIHWLEGNIEEDPQFAGQGNYPYALSDGSPCIDAGTPDTTGLNLPPWDILGNWRIWDGDGNGTAIVDMGAYEYGSIPVGIENPVVASQQSAVSSYPNPFSNSTIFEYELKENAKVTLTIFNHLGQKVDLGVNEAQSKGTHKLQWYAEGLPAGVYYCQLKTGNQVMAKKIIKL